MFSRDTDVYTGVWINHSLGKIHGATLTLTSESGGLLIAFLAIFVGAAAGSFWKIVRYALHMSFSSEKKMDAVHHQRQAILRNTQLPSDAAVDLIMARFAWRGRASKLDRKLTSVAFLAFIVYATFTVAGIFSSKVTAESGSEVLLTGSNCGKMFANWSEDIDWKAKAYTTYYSALSQKASEYLSYTHRCYQNRTNDIPDGCKTYVQSTLPYTKDANASCPFDTEMCQKPQGNMLLDTGYLDSNKYLGINRGPRFDFRLKRHCAPLQTEGYALPNTTDPNNPWMEYYYGASQGSGFPRPYSYRIRMRLPTPIEDWEDLKSTDTYKISSPGGIQPMPQMNKTQGYVSLMFLESPNVKYYAKVEDPWFSATTPFQAPDYMTAGINLVNNTGYVPDATAGVLACSTTMEFCNPALPGGRVCWDSIAGNVSWEKTWPNKEDQLIMNGFQQMLQVFFDFTAYAPEAFYAVNGLPSLLARYTLVGLLQPATIPPNQWQLETEYIFQSALAAAQARVVEHGRGNLLNGESHGTDCARTMDCERLCHSQKIRSPLYYSFSILGICIILVVGTAILLLGTFIESMVDFIARIPVLARRRKFTYARLEWNTNNKFQLQRLAHEGFGAGTWTNTRGGWPVTQGGETLANLDISDQRMPRLYAEKELGRVGQAYQGHEGYQGHQGYQGQQGQGVVYGYGQGYDADIAKGQVRHSAVEVDRGTRYSRLSMSDR